MHDKSVPHGGQKSKLIILRITRLPMIIHTAQASRTIFPVLVMNKRPIYFGLVTKIMAATSTGKTPIMPAEAFASELTALTFAFFFLSDPKTTERLASASA